LSTTSRNNSGFTLLEILIALLLLVILSGALYGTYFAMVKSRDRAVSGTEPLRDLRATLDIVRREISAAFYNKRNKNLHFVVEDRDIFGKPSSTLDFTAVSIPLTGTAPSSDLVRVRYVPRENEGKLLLMREEEDVYLENEPVPYPQMEEIQGFLVECYNGSKWVRSWDTDLNSSLPQAVRVTLTIKDGEKTSDYSVIAVPRARET
jgi:general secretion pathway protein J